MKLIQLNIWQGRLIRNVVTFLEREKPDILCLQELCSSPDNPRADMDFFGNLQALQKAFGFPHVFFSPLWDFNCMGLRVGFGNAILSRAPFTSTHAVFTNLAFQPDFGFHAHDYNIRNFQHAAVNVNGKPVHLINHHGHHVSGSKDGTPDTDRQMGMIADYIGTLEGGVIFAGDLNLLPESRSLRRLNEGMNNLCVAHGIRTTRNFTSFDANHVCDYIFVNDRVKVNDFRVHDEVISDHAALGLEFEAA